MPSIFQKIVDREIPSFIIEEDEFHLAFLDVNPLNIGHTLVIPKKKIDYLFDIENEDLASLIVFAKKVAIKIKSKIPCTKIGISVIGLEVPHAHIHLIPMNSISDMNFGNQKLNLSSEKLLEIQGMINS
jgi:histidine triad (HIT) family protein